MKNLRWVIVAIAICTATISLAEGWGVIRYVHSATNVRAERTTKSKVVGVLAAGQKVRADFLSENWYAVFSTDVEERSEANALGYVFAPLLKPGPMNKVAGSNKPGEGIPHEVVERKDYSYVGTSRMSYRVLMNVERIPSEEAIRRLANRIWRDGNTRWDEFTVFMYLPEMNTQSVAYATAKFTPRGMSKCSTNKYSLYGTKWE